MVRTDSILAALAPFVHVLAGVDIETRSGRVAITLRPGATLPAEALDAVGRCEGVSEVTVASNETPAAGAGSA